LVQEPERNRWAAKVGAEAIGTLTYQFAGERYVLISTHVADAYRHQGLATKLAIRALDDIRSTGRRITVICPFVGDVIARHPKYFDLVDPVHPGPGITGTSPHTSAVEDHAGAGAGGDRSAGERSDDNATEQTARIVVLGTIAYRGPLTVSGIADVHQQWAVSRWSTISGESIDQQVRALAASGLIRPQESAGAQGPEFHCTEQGRSGLHDLLLRLVRAERFQPFNLMPLLHFVTSLTPAELADGLRRRILYIDDVLEHESSAIAGSSTGGPDYPSEIHRVNWHRFNADRTWSLEFIGRLYATAASSSE
jgi:predicted GNAT family acetyltransferase